MPTGRLELLECVIVPNLREVGFLRSSVSDVLVEAPYVRELPYLKGWDEGVVEVDADDEDIDLYLVEGDESLLWVEFWEE